MNKKFYVTTAIDYTNDVIHIGHSYQKILADVLARYHRLIGNKTYFLTGTDEHGQKVEKSAKKKGIEPKKFVDQIAAANKTEWDKLNISYDRFIRTTDKDHVKFAQEIYLKSKRAGDIYLGEYDGLYCEGCEAYLTESDLKDGYCPFHPKEKLIKIKEKNYFFRLSKYQKFLEKLLEKNHQFVVPESKRKEALSFIKSGLNDFAVSRPNIKWGIPVPNDPEQTIYVWFDALINYLTYGEQKNCWPADVHVLGKDNLRFHAIYWPAMLKSTGYELPKTILIHDFISLNGQKISKSLGNIIRPSELVKQFGVDPVRYYFLRYGPLRNDTDFTVEKLKEAYNADLANGLGNLVARVLTLVKKNCNGKVPKVNRNPDSHPLRIGKNIHNWKKSWQEIDKFLPEYKFNEALESVWKFISEADRYIDQAKPWELAKKDKEQFNWVVYGLLDSIHQIAWQIYPFLPETSQEIAKRIKIKKLLVEKPLGKDSWVNIKPGTEIKVGRPLFPRLEKPAFSQKSTKKPRGKIIIGKVIALSPHPKAIKLKVVKVDIGSKEPLTIICGDSNLKKGQIVLVALPDSQVYQPKGKKLKVKKTNIRGLKSEGIICSQLEAGKGSNYKEVWKLPKETENLIGKPLSVFWSVIKNKKNNVG